MQNDPMRLLEHYNLRKTSVRKEVLMVFLNVGDRALSNGDIEEKTSGLDRITLYRTLKTFEEKGLIHKAIDGSGVAKYALCSDNCGTHGHQDEHAHFHCKTCGKTVCLDDIVPPNLSTPNGFKIDNVHLVLSGICADCSV